MTTDAELDAKLARVTERIQKRADDRALQLALMDNGSETAHDVAVLLRQRMQAKLVYVGPESGFPHGHPYDFNLVGPTYLATLERQKGTSTKSTATKEKLL